MTNNNNTASQFNHETMASGGGGGGGGCPVKHSSSQKNTSAWTSWFRSSSSPSTTVIDGNFQSEVRGGGGGGGCPVKHSSSSISSIQNKNQQQQQQLPKSIEEAARHAQTPQAGQTVPLSTVRTVSSILRTTPRRSTTMKMPDDDDDDTDIIRQQPQTTTTTIPTPHHQQTSTDKNWVYPSEQQFFNAMRRKGWDLPPGTELTIPHVVRIHNAVNEKGWSDVVEWEKLRGNTTPRLVRFMGRPDDLSPRAWFMSRIRMKKEPFDRHDWFVDDGGSGVGGGEGGERRYVIDFYGGEEKVTGGVTLGEEGKGLISRWWGGVGGASEPQAATAAPASKAPSMYLDVRPALDDTDAAYDHAAMFMKQVFPGIYEAVASRGSSSTSVGGSMMGDFTSSRTATGLQSSDDASSSSSPPVGKR